MLGPWLQHARVDQQGALAHESAAVKRGRGNHASTAVCKWRKAHWADPGHAVSGGQGTPTCQQTINNISVYQCSLQRDCMNECSPAGV